MREAAWRKKNPPKLSLGIYTGNSQYNGQFLNAWKKTLRLKLGSDIPTPWPISNEKTIDQKARTPQQSFSTASYNLDTLPAKSPLRD